MQITLNRKKSAVVVIIVLAVALFYYLGVYTSTKTTVVHGKYIAYNNLEELDQHADMILIGSPMKDFESRTHSSTFYQDGTLQDFFTLTDFKVKRIVKKPDSVNLKESDVFQVIEPVGVFQHLNGKEKLTIDNYQELKKGYEYIIFLKDNTFGKYSVINMNAGKFNLDGKDAADMTFDADEEQLKANKLKMKNEIQAKYKNFLQ